MKIILCNAGTRTLDKPWLSNDWEKSFLRRFVSRTIEKTHSALLNLAAVVAIFQPCTTWIKESCVNPTFHFLHFPRRWSLSDGAVHLCVASLLQLNPGLASDSGLFHTSHSEVQSFIPPLYSSLLYWTEPSPMLTPPSGVSMVGPTVFELYARLRVILPLFSRQ